jgi:hypothetical protein
MRRLAIILVVISLCIAADSSTQAVPILGNTANQPTLRRLPPGPDGRGVIAVVGDTRTILGPAGKNIVTTPNGAAIAVMYGAPSDPFDANNPIGEVSVAYSLDQGGTWSTYGPFNAVAPLRRVYPGTDGCKTFDVDAGNLFFCWQEAQNGYAFSYDYCMIEENMPSSPSFSTPVQILPDMSWWMPCPAVNPDDNSIVYVTHWSYIPDGNTNDYGNKSTDGGYTFGDTILVAGAIGELISAGHMRWGTDGYAFFTYHDSYNSVEYPYYVETTDYGDTWSAPATLPALTSLMQWWHEFDCEVVQNDGNDFPVTVHNDIDASGSGVMSLMFPDPDDPGGPGTWNWTAVSVDGIFTGVHTYNGTTYTTQVIQYPSVSFYDIGPYGLILVSYKAAYEIAPPPAGWTDGNYLGGVVSIDGGRTWRPTRPLSGPLLQAVGGATEVAHQLVVFPERQDEYWALTTWSDADDGVIGNQYFEIGQVLPIDLDGWIPGVSEYDDGSAVYGLGLTIAPTIARDRDCQVSFNITTPGQVCLKVYDALGRLIETAFNGHLDAGKQYINLSTSQLPNGVYIVSVEHNGTVETGKLISVR